MRSWIVIDSLYCAEQYFCSHLDAVGHYLRELGEDVTRCCLNGVEGAIAAADSWQDWIAAEDALVAGPFQPGCDVAFFLDGYGRALEVNATKRIAQVAAVCSPMPWEVRKADGSPAFDLVISSIPWMVEAARAAGRRAEYQALCFDTRAMVCGMGVERDIDCLFVGTIDGNHQKRAAVLRELGDLVTVMPPTFGRSYYSLLARSKMVLHVGAEWSHGARNALRIYEGAGMGSLVLSDGEGGGSLGRKCDIAQDFRGHIQVFADAHSARERMAWDDRALVLAEHGYVNRIPDLVRWVRELPEGAP